MPRDELNVLAAFAVEAEERSFTKAAGVTGERQRPPALSALIDALRYRA